MGLGGISVWQLLIVLAIVVMVFGTSRLRTLGGDLGSAINGFKRAMQEPGETGSETMIQPVERAAQHSEEHTASTEDNKVI